MLRLVVLCLAMASASFAAPVSCAAGSLADYLSLGAEGCSVGTTVFREFVNPGVLPGSTELVPGEIVVTPLMDPLSPGLAFTYDATADPGLVLQSVVEFVVFSLSPLQYGSLRMTGNSAAPGSALAVTSEICTAPQASACLAAPEVLGVFDVGVDAVTFDSRYFLPASLLRVRHDAVLDAVEGAVSIGTAELRFAAVPEPGTQMLVVAGLLCAAAVNLRRR
jgi:hypothetical protein